MTPYDENRITYLAETDARNKRVRFGIKSKDRIRHLYTIGKTGMGKSTMLENMAVQDIQNGEGFAFFDPHGASAEKLLGYVPEERIKDVLYFAPFDLDYPISFNVMEDVGADKRHLVANGLMSAFKKIWVDAWSARMEYILNNTLLALLEYPGSTLIGVNRMLADKSYRKKVADNVTDPSVKSFWVDEFEKYGERYMQEASAAIQNKIGQFISNPLVRNIIGQPKSSFDVRQIMDDQKILIVNLSKGKVGEANANLLGSMLITKIYLAAMSRADVTPDDMKTLPNFYLYVDEFQSFANESFANILSEARKYKLNLTIAHQYIEQMSEEVRAAVFGNVGTMVSFRVGAYDAEVLEKEFAPQFTAEDLVNLGFVQVYMKLMIDGVSSSPFSATTLPPIAPPRFSYVERILDNSRKAYASPRSDVEDFIIKWHESGREDKNKGGKPEFSDKRKDWKNNQTPTKRDIKEKVPNNVVEGIGVAKVVDNREQRKNNVVRPFRDAFKKVFSGASAPVSSQNRESELRKAISEVYTPEVKTSEISDTNNNKTEVKPIEKVVEKSVNNFPPVKKDERTINTKKDISPENLAMLKNAISSAGASKEVINQPYNKEEKQNEVPEERLRGILDIPEPDDL